MPISRAFDCPDRFVVGYGMDMAHAFRELPFVGHVVNPPGARSLAEMREGQFAGEENCPSAGDMRQERGGLPSVLILPARERRSDSAER
jgi:hypothetical protein